MAAYRNGITAQRQYQSIADERVRFPPDSLASGRLMPVARGSLDEAINVLASCSRIEERAKRTSGVGPTRVCVTAGETAILNDERSDSPSRKERGNENE